MAVRAVMGTNLHWASANSKDGAARTSDARPYNYNRHDKDLPRGAGPVYLHRLNSSEYANRYEDHTGDPGPAERLFCRCHIRRKDGMQDIHQTTNHEGGVSPDPVVQGISQDMANDDQQDTESVLFSPIQFHKITSRRGRLCI